MSLSVLVTGAAGFIGSHLSEALLARGDRVLGLDNLNDFYDPALKRKNLDLLSRFGGFDFVEGDIRDEGALRAALTKSSADTVVHLAAMAGVRPSIEHPAEYADVNVRGTGILLEAAVSHGIEKFVFASSSSIYGERSDPPFRETDRVDHPVSPYAATKKAGELLCHSIHVTRGLPVSVLRYFTVYGERQRPEMAIAKFSRLIEDGKPVPVFGDGTSGRDYTFVGDIVNGTVRAMDRCRDFAIYNLGGSEITTLNHLLRVLGDEMGREVSITRLANQPGDVSLTSACVDHAHSELGYSPAVSFREGIRRYVAWFRGETS